MGRFLTAPSRPTATEQSTAALFGVSVNLMAAVCLFAMLRNFSTRTHTAAPSASAVYSHSTRPLSMCSLCTHSEIPSSVTGRPDILSSVAEKSG